MLKSRWSSVLRRENLQMAGKLTVVVALMGGFGYAMVPIYRSVCEALGINSLTQADRKDAVLRNTQVDASRTIRVEFDANSRGVWTFKPAVSHLDVHPGEVTTVMYEFRNSQSRTLAAQAIPSYAPIQAQSHFNKLECFCFNEYTLAPGESKQWPVVFVVDNKLPRDVKTITLSYTFFEVPGKLAKSTATKTAERKT
jgi:cytochrome c oxidase assembly protein subunit 11